VDERAGTEDLDVVGVGHQRHDRTGGGFHARDYRDGCPRVQDEGNSWLDKEAYGTDPGATLVQSNVDRRRS
jgi:hypothetical protein